MSPEQDKAHPVMWEWTDEGGGGGNNYHAAVASAPHWAYPNDDTDFATDCDCSDLPPPPKFALPPPPLPFGGADDCHSPSDNRESDAAARSGSGGSGSRLLADLEYCDMRVLEGPYTQTAIPSLLLIVGCSFVMLVMVLVAFLLFRKHKRKMQNFLPCKASPGNHCDLASGNSVLYEDLTNIRPRNLTNHCAPNQTVAPMEHPEDNTLLDVKCSNYGGAGFTSVGNTTFIYQPAAAENIVLKNCKSKDHFNQAYEEVSAGTGSSEGKRAARDSDFATDLDDDDECQDEEDEEEEDLDDLEERQVAAEVETRKIRVPQRSSLSSEGELAEDELSLVDFRQPKKSYTTTADGHQVVEVDLRSPDSCSGDSSVRGSTGDDLCRDFDSVYNDSEDNNCHHPTKSNTFQQGPAGPMDERIFSYDGPSSSSSGERRRRRKRNGGPASGRSDLYGRNQNAYPVYSEIHDVVNGDNHHHPHQQHRGVTPVPYCSRPSRSSDPPGRGTVNVGGATSGPHTWRTSNLNNGGDLYDVEGYNRNGGCIDSGNHQPEMVLVINPAQRRDLPRPPSGLGGGDLGLKSHHRPPPSCSAADYSTQPQSLWGPDYPPGAQSSSVAIQRNSDPHERSLAEFSTFQPKRGSSSVPVRDLYGLDAGHLNNDVGVGSTAAGPYSHLPTGQHRNSGGSEGSRSSTSSAEHLLPANDPYHHQKQQLPVKPFRQIHHNHQPQPQPLLYPSAPPTSNRQQHHHQQPHFLPEILPGSPATGIHRQFPSNHRSNNRRKSAASGVGASGNKSASGGKYADDLDAPYGARTVFT